MEQNVPATLVGLPLVLRQVVHMPTTTALTEAKVILGSVANKWFATLAVSIVETNAKFANYMSLTSICCLF